MTTAYVSLSVQVAQVITAHIEAGRWVDWLPGERTLVTELTVSRKTVRKALALLEHDGMIVAESGKGHRIVASGGAAGEVAAGGSVGLLLPESVEVMRTFTNLWINDLRIFLAAHDLRLRVFSGHKYYSKSPSRALERICQQSPQKVWVLSHSTEVMQRWFERRGLPAVVAGSIHGRVKLPSVDLDYQAVCRHAAGTMLRGGHRQLAIVVGQPERAGDRESITGFERAIDTQRHPDASVKVFRHDCSPGGVNRLVQRMLRAVTPPTAILVANSAHYLAIHTGLAAQGRSIPGEVSLISRDDDPYLAFVHPEPTRYGCPPAHMARMIGRVLLRIGSEQGLDIRAATLMPEMIKGASFKRLVG
ncbi:GntR family transcriptional regulator [Synoicihabitans lomoniglobus]|uniref:GntR family transcriptional regulator n=1 Tax=Synoicihabitans lomoniglobus TaxID=2909285 RepID=A0AAF0CI70_9BACT|nr:GntR family transcriptional regulator [Opitutaceae bacterium LMO-M01]WED65057.1 GntR family transcriptional regulator [Opitutaceae bacterium LMO-M01]